ncbi:MAG: hypothetical protein HDT21_13725 [Ruminococcus sp.]|nr:hypothetical protein [Ruminococcus sp.]
MLKHPKTLEETALWELYEKKVPEKDSSRRVWVKDIYENAVTYLKHVCDTFPNYTLHDEKHVLNVIYAMGAILGDQIDNLSIGEIELLILAAALHDIGMVYDETDRQNAFNDERKCMRFLKENSPELIGVPYTEWSEDTKQWYLRTLHPFRLHEILSTGKWKALFDKRPREIVPEQNIIAVCQSHGEEPLSIKNNDSLKYLPAYETEPLFCAMLLRLADLLDFDDTRAPRILFKYAADNEESVKEWRKHIASMGFIYPETPSNDELVFSAECNDPGEEYSVREFLDWIDNELITCGKLQRNCDNEWKREFPFPRSVLRDNIISVGYVSDKFMLTMDQNQILKLLTGENLYDSNDVFVRELLQNAIDAVLLRGKMDNNFKIEDARIDLWEWNDKDGNIWFRIDDQGTGMTPGMLKKYFLKVGNSYYTSQELKRDLVNHSSDKDYFGISRFGIGFLSCFLCGIEAEVSTLYFDDSKSKIECDSGAGDRNGYGLRMQITGLSGYYTLRSQADDNIINTLLPAPEFINSVEHSNLEYNGYRSKAGTSIVIKLDPGKLGAINLKASVEKYIYGTHMPVFYNGKRIGFTYSEIMEAAHKFNGETVYELSEEEKEKYDKTFPNIKGQYPKIVITVVPLDTPEYQVMPNLSGIILKYNVHFDNSPKWQVMDQIYTISTSFQTFNEIKYIYIRSVNTKESSEYYVSSYERLLETYDEENLDTLKQALGKFRTCPASAEELGTAWLPFAENEDISEVWLAFVDEKQNAAMRVELNNKFNLNALTSNMWRLEAACVYQGILMDDVGLLSNDGSINAVFFLENELQPTVDIGRTKISALPLEAIVAICNIACHPNLDFIIKLDFEILENISSLNLHEWRYIFDSELGRWVLKTQNKRILQIHELLQTPIKKYIELYSDVNEYNLSFIALLYGSSKIIYKFVSAYFQDIYDMNIYYEDGQCIIFTKKENIECNNTFDKFPPMMFCKAGSDKSRRYLCCSLSEWRRGITLDHPFAQWLVENVVKIENHFPHQFYQIVYSLCNNDAQGIIKIVNDFRQQLIQLNGCHGIDVTSLRELTNDDFWDPAL